MTDHKTGTRAEWTAARAELLEREKEYTRLGDELARRRRELPWVRLEKEYRLDTEVRVRQPRRGGRRCPGGRGSGGGDGRRGGAAPDRIVAT